MAIDTAEKRASVVGVTTVMPRAFPFPAGIIDREDRAFIGFNYTGFAAGPPIIIGSIFQWWTRMWNPYNKGVAITPSDTVNMIPGVSMTGGYPTSEAIYVGGAGIVAAVFQDGTVANFTAAAGEILPLRCIRVNNTDTTASLLVALYTV